MAKEQVNAKHQKFVGLLKELFQLDQPDLDFGLYRIMHAKSAEVTQFLDKDLLPQVKAAFGLYKTADKGELEKNKQSAGGRACAYLTLRRIKKSEGRDAETSQPVSHTQNVAK